MRIALTLAALMALGTTTAHAMEAKQTIEREVSVVMEDGSVMLRREAADLVTPGDALIYTLDFVNTEAEAANDISMSMPVPQEVRFVETIGTLAQSRVTYSADNGSSYADRDALIVRAQDGQSRAASNDDITHVRWTIERPIEVGEQGTVAFRGELR